MNTTPLKVIAIVVATLMSSLPTFADAVLPKNIYSTELTISTSSVVDT